MTGAVRFTLVLSIGYWAKDGSSPGANVEVVGLYRDGLSTGDLPGVLETIRDCSGRSTTGLMMVSAFICFCSTSGRMGMLICSICLAR